MMMIVLSFTSATTTTSIIGPSRLFAKDRPGNTNNKNKQDVPIEELTTFEQISTKIIRDRFRATVVAFYDSADLNSWRMKPYIEEGANQLKGFTNFYAVDIRNPNMTMLRAAWGVTTIPWIYGLGPKNLKPRTDDFASSSSLSLATGLRGPIHKIPHFGDFQPQAVRKFGLSLVADSSLVVQHVETVEALEKMQNDIASSNNNNNNNINNIPSIVLLTDKSSSSLLYRALAANFAKRANFFEVNVKKLATGPGNKDVMKLFDATKLPHLMVFGSGEKKEKTVYDGQLNIVALEEFLFPSFITETREQFEQRLYQEHQASMNREVKRRESPLLKIETQDDWNVEVEDRAGVVGVIVLPTSSTESGNGEESLEQRAHKAVRELRAKEESKRSRTNVVQFLLFERGNEKLSKVEDVLLSGHALSDEEKNSKPGVYFISSRKKVATKFVGALSGDGLYGFMKNELKNGIGVRSVDMNDFKKAFSS